MSATKQRKQRTHRGKPLVSDDQLLEFVAMMQTMYKRGWTQDQLANALGYRTKESLRQISKLASYPTYERYSELKRLHASTEVPAVTKAPAQQAKPAVVPRNGALEAITDAEASLASAAARLTAAAEGAIPLLRPGLLQAAERINNLRKELEI